MRLLAIVVAVAASGCAAPTGLTVDVRTDYQPSVDFSAVQTEVSAHPFVSPAPDGSITSHPAALGDYARGVRVDERPAIASGDWYVRVTLLASSGARVAQRTVAVHVTGRRSLTVVLARSCASVTCPSTDPALTECSGGVCVSPRCSPENPLACPTPACTSDGECAAPGPCARATCASGVCLAVPDDARCMGGTCGGDFVCHAGPADAGPADASAIDAAATPDAGSDAGIDAAMTTTSFTLRFLAPTATTWQTIVPSGDAPTAPIETAFAQAGTDELMVLTHTELFVMRVSTRTFVERRSRDAVFPDLAGLTLGSAAGVNGDLYITAHDVWVYTWANAIRTATLQTSIRHENLGADWHGPLTPPWFREYESWYVPSNASGWAHVDPMQVCGTGTVDNYIAYLSWDGFGPAAMITTIWDAGCFQFVDRSVYGSTEYTPFSFPGAPPMPFDIVGAEWSNGLWVFTTP
jgi:hypothetical protein